MGKWEFAEAARSVCQVTALDDVRGWDGKGSARWSLDSEKGVERTWGGGDNRTKGRS